MRDQVPRRATQDDLIRAASRYPTARGASQPELRQPLTDAELEAGGGYVVGITSVDMTPRPRYGESQQAFEQRMVALGADLQELRNEVKQRNRKAALRAVPDAALYFTQCACGWCGLRVEDPEVARREYDVHVCVAEGVGQAAVDRAIAETDRNVLTKRTRAVLQPAIVELPAAVDEMRSMVADVEVDDFAQRVALLETK